MNVLSKYKADMDVGHLEPRGVLSTVWTNRNNAQKVTRKQAFSEKLQMSVDVRRKFVV